MKAPRSFYSIFSILTVTHGPRTHAAQCADDDVDPGNRTSKCACRELGVSLEGGERGLTPKSGVNHTLRKHVRYARGSHGSPFLDISCAEVQETVP